MKGKVEFRRGSEQQVCGDHRSMGKVAVRDLRRYTATAIQKMFRGDR